MPPKDMTKNKRVYSSLDWENWRNQFNLWIINPDEVQKQTCEKLKSDFGLSDDEAKNYYEMIKDEKNNKIIKEIEEKVRVKISPTDTLKFEYNKE